MTPLSKTLITGTSSTFVFAATDNTGGGCGTVYILAAVVPPSGGNAGLITIPSATTVLITFAASSVVADAGAY